MKILTLVTIFATLSMGCATQTLALRCTSGDKTLFDGKVYSLNLSGPIAVYTLREYGPVHYIQNGTCEAIKTIHGPDSATNKEVE